MYFFPQQELLVEKKFNLKKIAMFFRLSVMCKCIAIKNASAKQSDRLFRIIRLGQDCSHSAERYKGKDMKDMEENNFLIC